jgi:hypothetical protein
MGKRVFFIFLIVGLGATLWWWTSKKEADVSWPQETEIKASVKETSAPQASFIYEGKELPPSDPAATLAGRRGPRVKELRPYGEPVFKPTTIPNNPVHVDYLTKVHGLSLAQIKTYNQKGFDSLSIIRVLELAKQTGRRPEEIVLLKTSPSRGWGRLIRDLGLPPPQFNASVRKALKAHSSSRSH